MIRVTAPLSREAARKLRSGDRCLLSGVIYTARDAAHKRLCQALEEGKELPIDLTDAVIYFAGPAPAKPGDVIGSAGPTTSYRMDAYSPRLMAQGSTGMIGKGRRDQAVIDAMGSYGAVYFGAAGGCGALIRRCIRSAAVVAYEDLGAEAIYRLEVEDFPVTVIIDTLGNDLYETGPKSYLAASNQE
jgi:fumarate hydratase subunit beta